MAKSYQMSNNTIFCVNEDGSISKFAAIGESGEIYRIGGTGKKIPSKKWGVLIIITLSAIVISIMGILYYKAYDTMCYYREECGNGIVLLTRES